MARLTEQNARPLHHLRQQDPDSARLASKFPRVHTYRFTTLATHDASSSVNARFSGSE